LPATEQQQLGRLLASKLQQRSPGAASGCSGSQGPMKWHHHLVLLLLLLLLWM
jgi:hypothetical protein